jgi:hypothetical protein
MSLYPQKRTLELNREMSALCQKQIFVVAAETRQAVRRVLWGLRCFNLTPPNGGRGRLICGVLNAETIPAAICQTLLKGGVDAM